MAKVSIVIPVYNQALYVKKCLHRAMNQTYRDLEIIVIDDGSTDESAKICDEIALIDPRVKVVHIENHGVSYARNLGIELSTGEYIHFIDSDDFVETTIIEKLLRPLKEHGSDLSICGYVKHLNDSKKTVTEVSCINFTGTYESFLDKIEGFLAQNLIQGPCFKLYHRKIMMEHELRFPLGLSFGEDTLFVYDYLTHCQTITSIEDSLYHVTTQENSLRSKIRIDKIDLYLRLYDRLKELFDAYPSQKRTSVISRFFCHSFVSAMKEFYLPTSGLTQTQRRTLLNQYVHNTQVQNHFKNYTHINVKIKRIRWLVIHQSVALLDVLFRLNAKFQSK